MATRRKKRRTPAQRAATKRMLAAAKRARVGKKKHRRHARKLAKFVGVVPHKSSGRMYGPALPPGYGYEAVPGGMRSAKKKRRKKAKRKAAPKRRKTARRTKRTAHKTVSAKSILKAARGPKIWVCVGRVKTGCGGGKRGGHVMGGIRIS